MAGYVGNIPVPQSTQARQSFTATASQTSFPTIGYTAGFIDVYLNGVKILDGVDYTATNGSDVVLTTGAALNDILEVTIFDTFTTSSASFANATLTSSTLKSNVTLKNDTHEDSDGGRASKIIYQGEQSGGEISTLAEIQASHDGTADDQKGSLLFKTNDGSDGTSPTEMWRITSEGHFKAATNGNGIDFSATEGSAAASSILDDFEEGSFTPIFSGARPGGGDVTVNTQLGRYTKVGNIVHISLVLGVNGSTVDANNSAEVTITGLPYTIVNISSQNFVPISMFPQSGWNQSSATQGYTNLLHNNTTNIVFYGIVTSASTNFNSVQYNQLGRANSNDSLMVRLNGVYRVAT